MLARETRNLGGLNPRCDQITQKYIDSFDERAVPRIKLMMLYSKLQKRGYMHFVSSGATVYAMSELIFDVVRVEVRSLGDSN